MHVINLQTKMQVKKYNCECKWASSLTVHPQGNNVIVGSLDKKLIWIDL